MTRVRLVGISVCSIVLSAHLLHAQDLSRYREFRLGSDLAGVAGQIGVPVSTAKLLHQRPAVLQELEWRPRYYTSGMTPTTDPVRQIVFSFYNDQLFKVVVDYDRERTEGLKDEDLIDAMSAIYGSPLPPAPKSSRALTAQVNTENGVPIARWGNSEYSFTLFRPEYGGSFRLVVVSVRLDALAGAATTEALRLDTREAPQREVARQKKETDDSRTALAKARLVNKPAFRP